jgi:cytochrome c556
MNKYAKLGLAAGCACATLAVAVAQTRPSALTPEQRAHRAVELRQSVMQVQAYSLGPAAAMTRGAPFDAETAQKAAARLKVLSGMIADAFKTDTSKLDVKTRAKPDIWTDKTGFDSHVNDEVKAVDALESAAMGGDKDATLNAIKAVGKSCGGCHEQYREKSSD